MKTAGEFMHLPANSVSPPELCLSFPPPTVCSVAFLPTIMKGLFFLRKGKGRGAICGLNCGHRIDVNRKLVAQ